jgi:hypothetical protein
MEHRIGGLALARRVSRATGGAFESRVRDVFTSRVHGASGLGRWFGEEALFDAGAVIEARAGGMTLIDADGWPGG